MTRCPSCGREMASEAPRGAMGEPMRGRGVDIEYCDNPRCPRFMHKGGCH